MNNRVRFDVLKRDGFTCQYCGRRPPEVVLHVDHIHPRSKGGWNEPDNLITSCGNCNIGKSNHALIEVPRCFTCGEQAIGAFFDVCELPDPTYLCNHCITRSVEVTCAVLTDDEYRCYFCGQTFLRNPAARYSILHVSMYGLLEFCEPCLDAEMARLEALA